MEAIEGQWTVTLLPGPLLRSHREPFLRQFLWGQALLSLSPSEGAPCGQAEPSPDQPTLCLASVGPSESKPKTGAGNQVQSSWNLEKGQIKMDKRSPTLHTHMGRDPEPSFLLRRRTGTEPHVYHSSEAGVRLAMGYTCV